PGAGAPLGEPWPAPGRSRRSSWWSGTCAGLYEVAGRVGQKLYRNAPRAALVTGATRGSKCDRKPERNLKQILHDRGPGVRDIAAVVPPAPQGKHAPVAESVRELRQLTRGPPVSFRREAQMGDRIAFQAVGTALEDDELWRKALEVSRYPRPDGCESSVFRAGRQRQVELRALGRASGGFLLTCVRVIQYTPY